MLSWLTEMYFFFFGIKCRIIIKHPFSAWPLMTQHFFSKSSAVKDIFSLLGGSLLCFCGLKRTGHTDSWSWTKEERLFFLFQCVCSIQHSWGDKRRDSSGILRHYAKTHTVEVQHCKSHPNACFNFYSFRQMKHTKFCAIPLMLEGRKITFQHGRKRLVLSLWLLKTQSVWRSCWIKSFCIPRPFLSLFCLVLLIQF